VGDQALINAAHIIRDSIGDIGLAVRYAGDEFVVLLNTSDSAVGDQTMNEIRRRFSSFSSNGMHQYGLSASMGQFQMEPCRQSLEQFMANIDNAMYEDKKRYYEMHPEADRRASK
jgi:diguanylate cyclase (GGDEF)-like protein